ncbi:biliverdin-producing heme oxygenase [Alteromonas lipolytica]|uniref:Heme oxygenase n=1 Tax=Alteromonas lipolytica TaxID=1856405 RepID=A0A1E8FGY1_9ALTE|nr:biliverdin-producing heme oxygenase [Alteromonas lipolytica]OFI35202.1 hypothetical protein BFC17_16815 [Alteromonas lipolytica]GGF57585.1 hypothetical protein GCM10011338_07290 [Alteromonas lipolytica]
MSTSVIYEQSQLHTLLKAHTGDLHRQLDSHYSISILMSANLSEKSYASVLLTMLCWYRAIGNALVTKLNLARDLPFYEAKDLLIEKDLMALSVCPKALINSPANALAIPAKSSLFYLGMLYVVEGSALGGMVLGPRVAKQLGRGDVTAFYQCYGKNKTRNFAQTLNYITRQINENDVPEEAMDEVLSGAAFAFTSLLQVINDNQ